MFYAMDGLFSSSLCRFLTVCFSAQNQCLCSDDLPIQTESDNSVIKMARPDYPDIQDMNQERIMKFFYFVSLIGSALYLLIFLPKLRTRREPIAYWGSWAYLGANAIFWAVYGLLHYI